MTEPKKQQEKPASENWKGHLDRFSEFDPTNLDGEPLPDSLVDLCKSHPEKQDRLAEVLPYCVWRSMSGREWVDAIVSRLEYYHLREGNPLCGTVRGSKSPFLTLVDWSEIGPLEISRLFGCGYCFGNGYGFEDVVDMIPLEVWDRLSRNDWIELSRGQESFLMWFVHKCPSRIVFERHRQADMIDRFFYDVGIESCFESDDESAKETVEKQKKHVVAWRAACRVEAPSHVDIPGATTINEKSCSLDDSGKHWPVPNLNDGDDWDLFAPWNEDNIRLGDEPDPEPSWTLQNLRHARGAVPSEAFVNDSSLESVVIPNGVTELGSRAFQGCINLTTVSIPDSVRTIGMGTFEGCSNLKSLSIPDSVHTIGFNAFSGCSAELFDTTTIPGVQMVDGWIVGMDDNISENVSLTGVSFSGVRGIAEGAFAKSSKLRSIVIPESVRFRGEWAFAGCRSLKRVTFPSQLPGLDGTTFLECTELESVEVGTGMIEIAPGAFLNCAKLSSVTIPDTVAHIGERAFAGCHGLSGITLPNRVTNIGAKAFAYAGLVSFVIPDKVSSISERQFFGCSKLTSVTIPNGMLSIGREAFAGCTKLAEVILPDSIERIEPDAFWNCGNVLRVRIGASLSSLQGLPRPSESYQTSASSQCFSCQNGVLFSKDGTRLLRAPLAIKGSFFIPEGVVEIVDLAFRDCKNLESVHLPQSLRRIGHQAFKGCSALRSDLKAYGIEFNEEP